MTFRASPSAWWWFVILEFTYKIESVVEPNLSLSCGAPRRGAPRLRASEQSGVVAEPQPWHG